MEIPILNLLYHFYTKFKKLPIYGRSILFLIRHWRKIAVSFANRRMLISRVPMPGEKIVVVLFPAHPLRITGGLFVLLNLAMISREILSREGFKVVVAYPPHWRGLPCYPYYPNKEGIYAFSQIMRLFPSPDTLYIHVPECVATRIFKKQKSREVRWIYSARQVHINICNQNPQLMPTPHQLDHLYRLPCTRTQTVAHEASATQEYADRWQIPLLHLGAYYGSTYTYRTHAEKQNIIAYSPDTNPHAPAILAMLHRRFKGFRLYSLAGIPYTTYLEAISRSKYVISFGEGWDGYFWEPFFCGTVTCCVRSPQFFPEEYNNFSERIYTSYDSMLNNLASLIEKFESNPFEYDAHALECYNILYERIESIKSHFHNSAYRLYRNEFDFYPVVNKNTNQQ